MDRPTMNSTELTLHLADRGLTALFSTANSPPTLERRSSVRRRAQALSALTANAIMAYDSAFQLRMGLPQRIMIETQSSGPVILHSFLPPPAIQSSQPLRALGERDAQEDIIEQARNGLRTLNADQATRDGGEALINGRVHDRDFEEELRAQHTPAAPPLLIASVVASSPVGVTEARRAAVRLERLGSVFHREWTRDQEEARLGNPSGEA